VSTSSIVGGLGRTLVMVGGESLNADQMIESIHVESDVSMIVRKVTFLSWIWVDGNTHDLMLVETDPGGMEARARAFVRRVKISTGVDMRGVLNWM
jgi:hypothetical protein